MNDLIDRAVTATWIVIGQAWRFARSFASEIGWLFRGDS